MQTTHKQMRELKKPHGVPPPTNAYSPHSRNAAFQACEACYSRKKRCVMSPSHHQCTYCFREGQRCVPRERPVRRVRKYVDEASDEPPRPKYDLPLPHGIDHEVPRWSAVYSMFSEMMRLIPPGENGEGEENEAKNNRKRAVSTDDEHSPNRKKSCPANKHSSSRASQAPDIQQTPNTMIHEAGHRTSSSGVLPTSKPSISAPTNRPLPGNNGTGICFGELDGLLRF
ncbi:uncharacterized protein N7482_007539 [Penicillium canariense]|uniref:Zn(2)-C6 fungal-type domain-containing protein n=1 Tax=Penicillium canariense TaxID=189055 RepID=A0A9W9LJY4_9EURO|nr:uncharacterized protein N7482_007539 [Penicillium canariense]KAJ5160535.1 hypothetical protein N7482_007539 [Penicillium canariense]